MLLKGTFYLTAAGAVSRIAGFFYKIFLSRAIGAEEIGLFHLCMPVYAFGMAAASGGIQTAISRFTAQYTAKGQFREARRILACALILSLSLALFCGALLYCAAGWIAEIFLAEPRCAPLLQIIACSLPFCVVHTCVSGYFIGKKRAAIPAFSQLIEQCIRITAAVFFCSLFHHYEQLPKAAVMALGQLAGETASCLFCMYFVLAGKRRQADAPGAGAFPSKRAFWLSGTRKLLQVSVPLGMNRMLLCVLQAIEAALLPQQLVLSGLSSSDALALYGTLSGMTLPLLLFPTAITGPVGMQLLPLISEAQTLNQEDRVRATAKATFTGSLLLGLFFFSAFFLAGKELGMLLFDSVPAGAYLQMLSLVCPFLYLNTTVINILHGIGKTSAASFYTSAGFLLRLASVILLVPGQGMRGYFWGILAGQVLVTALSLWTLYRENALLLSVSDAFLKPALLCLLTIGSVSLLRQYLPFLLQAAWFPVFVNLLLCFAIFASLTACGLLPRIRKSLRR